MDIHSIPDSIDELDRWSRAYERAHVRDSDGSRQVADDTLGLFLARYPAPLRPLVRPAVLALLEEPLLDAFGYRHPPGWLRRAVARGLRLRAWALARAPRRTSPHLITAARHPSYPTGHRLEDLGVPDLD